jgi:hypothetical protein
MKLLLDLHVLGLHFSAPGGWKRTPDDLNESGKI